MSLIYAARLLVFQLWVILVKNHMFTLSESCVSHLCCSPTGVSAVGYSSKKSHVYTFRQLDVSHLCCSPTGVSAVGYSSKKSHVYTFRQLDVSHLCCSPTGVSAVGYSSKKSHVYTFRQLDVTHLYCSPAGVTGLSSSSSGHGLVSSGSSQPKKSPGNPTKYKFHNVKPPIKHVSGGSGPPQKVSSSDYNKYIKK